MFLSWVHTYINKFKFQVLWNNIVNNYSCIYKLYKTRTVVNHMTGIHLNGLIF